MNRKALYILIAFIAVGFLIIGGGYLYHSLTSQADVSADKANSQVKAVTISSGEGVFKIAAKLEEKEIIDSQLSFFYHLLIGGNWSNLKAGQYWLNTNQPMEKIISSLASGRTPQIKLTIKEGWDIDKIDSYLAQGTNLKVGQFKKQAKLRYYKDDYSFLSNLKREGLEGYLFPDSYFVLADFTSDQLITKMLAAFESKVYKEYSKSKLPRGLKNFDQLVNLASIVEKEASDYQDRQLVAGIFLKRLKNGKKLQSCATVNYLLDEPKDILKNQDLEIGSPYNTYSNLGLPPAPISNPSSLAIKACLNYKQSDYWYFLSDKEGNLHFSVNSDQHLGNQHKYLD